MNKTSCTLNSSSFVRMSQRVKEVLSVLKRVNRMSGKAKKKFLKTCNKDFIHCICECVRNLLKGHVPMKQSQLKSLGRHKRSLRSLALKQTSLAKRKQILQKGGFIGALIGPLVTGLGSLIAGLLNNNAPR